MIQRAALYIRVSTDKQEDLSPDAQRRLLIDYAEKHQITIEEDYIFLENGISGKKAEKRPQFQRMIAAAKQKPRPFDVILVWKFSRFARNQEESIVYKSMLRKKCGIDIVSISEPIIDGPFGSLIERIIEWMDEYYSIRLSGEVMRGMTENAMRGNIQWVLPFGYCTDANNQPVPVPEEAKIVQEIFSRFVFGESMYGISKDIAQRGILTKRKKPFTKNMVKYILKNETYIGTYIWNKPSGDKTIRIENAFEPIISSDLFDTAHEKLKKLATGPQIRPSETYGHWLSGLLKCSNCGGTLVVHHNIIAGKRYGSFQCNNYCKSNCDVSHSISTAKAEAALFDSLQNIIDTGFVSFQRVSSNSSRDNFANLQMQIKQIEAKEKRARDAYLAGIDSIEDYKATKKQLDDEKMKIKKQVDKISTPDPEVDKKEMLKRISDINTFLKSENVSITEKSNAVRSIIQKIVYDKSNKELIFYYYLAK